MVPSSQARIPLSSKASSKRGLRVQHGCGNAHALPKHVRFLGRHAFATVLQRKQARYGAVLEALHAQLRNDSYYRGLAASMADVVDPRRTQLFLAGILF